MLRTLAPAPSLLRLAAVPWAGGPDLLLRLQDVMGHQSPAVVLIGGLHWLGPDVLDRLSHDGLGDTSW